MGINCAERIFRLLPKRVAIDGLTMSSLVPVIDLDAEAIVSSPEATETPRNPSLSSFATKLADGDSGDSGLQGEYEAELVHAGVLRVRDFAFDANDERPHGHSYVIPSKNTPPSFHCVALYDFTPEADNELPLQAGVPVEAYSVSYTHL